MIDVQEMCKRFAERALYDESVTCQADDGTGITWLNDTQACQAVAREVEPLIEALRDCARVMEELLWNMS